MMTNLFSSFDPTSNFMSSNWTASLMFILLTPCTMWMMKQYNMIMFNNILNKIYHEFKTIMGNNKNTGIILMLTSLFMLLLMNNVMGLFPYIFTSTSHLTITLALSAPIWMSLMFKGWFNHTNHMFAHLVPNGTPPMLMMFMVLIETISNMIRPITLAVRLAANMIAGHLLMTLLCNQTSESNAFMILSLLITQVMLLTLESAVCMIQSYVFATLSSLYTSEILTH